MLEGDCLVLELKMDPLTSLWSEHQQKASQNFKRLLLDLLLSIINYLSLRYVKVNSVFGTKGNLSWQSTSIRLAAIEKITPINWQVFQSSTLRNLILISLILSEVE